MEGDSDLILEKGEAQTRGVPLFFAHWHIFAPTVIIFVGYALLWFFLSSTGKSDTNLARLFIVVMSVFVPLLAAHAFLRFQTIRLQINPNALACHTGWPMDLPVEVPLAMIENVTIKRGLAGRLFGGGTIILQLPANNTFVITDLAEPDDAKAAIESAVLNR